MYEIINVTGFKSAIKKAGCRFAGIEGITDELGDMYLSEPGKGPVEIILRGGVDNEKILVQLMRDSEDNNSNMGLQDALNEFGVKADLSC